MLVNFLLGLLLINWILRAHSVYKENVRLKNIMIGQVRELEQLIASWKSDSYQPPYLTVIKGGLDEKES